jgi:hypothetical protein
MTPVFNQLPLAWKPLLELWAPTSALSTGTVGRALRRTTAYDVVIVGRRGRDLDSIKPPPTASRAIHRNY